MVRSPLSLLLYAAAFTAVVACNRTTAPTASEPPSAAAANEADDGGPAERVVSILPGATELLFAVDAGDRVVARSLHCDFPPEALALPSVGSGMSPDVERILSLRPTLVVGGAMQSEYPAVQSLGAAGVEVLLLPDQHIADLEAALRTLGRRLDRAEQAEAQVLALRAGLADAAPDAPRDPPPRVLVAVGVDPIYAAGDRTFIDELLRNAGAINVVRGDWVRLDDETVVAMAPDVIVQPTEDPAAMDTWRRFGDAVPAVRDGRLCPLSPNPLARCGPRIVEAARQLRACLDRP